MPTKAQISLVQYVPNQIRDERINIAVIMQVPELNYAGVRVRPYMDKALKLLWPEVDAEIIRMMVRSIEEELKPLEREPRLPLTPPMEFALDERATTAFLEQFSQVYGPIRISPSKPVRLRDGISFREKLEQLFNTYVRVEGSHKEVQNVTKDVIQDRITRELEKRRIIYQPNYIIKGEYWPNKFDLSRPRIQEETSIVQVISFDNEKVDQPIFQCQRLIQAVHDIPRVERRKYGFGVALQAPTHYPQHNAEYSSALRALRGDFTIFQNIGLEDELTETVIEALENPGVLKAG